MQFACEETPLENVFSILRFRSRGLVSFRWFVVMRADPEQDARDLRADLAATQPMRILAS